MKQNYGQFLLILFVFMTVFYSWRSLAAPHGCCINKVFHHRGASQSLEAGSCVLYVDKSMPVEPQITKDTKNNIEQHELFLKGATFNGSECERMVKRANKGSDQRYSLSLVEVNNKNMGKGVLIRVRYPIGTCSVAYKQFESIGRQKGLVLYVYDQTIIDKMRNAEKPILQTASNNRYPPRIIIDYGHGGSDTGAVGCGHIQEKDVCLSVGSKVVHLLRQKGYDVYPSRATDCDVPLDERTTRANVSGADVFVSIHANAAGNPQARGIETFCLQKDTLHDAVTNKTSKVVDAALAARCAHSKQLASCVQQHLCTKVQSYHDTPSLNRGVKYAASQVLMGSHMPAILVELGFVTHPSESKLLANAAYQKRMAQGIVSGIMSYLSHS